MKTMGLPKPGPVPGRGEIPIRRIGRRRFLGAIAAAGTSAVLGDALITDAPWLDYDGQVRLTWDTPFRTGAAMPEQIRELIRYATLAPSGHNTQPWRFAVLEDTIRILPDYSRRLPVIDPLDRELWISLGCALGNLEIAAQKAGYATETAYPTPDADNLAVHLRPMRLQGPAPLADAIPHRQSTRSPYDGHPVPLVDLRKIENAAFLPGISLQILTASEQKAAVLEYVKSADQRQYGDQYFVNELVSWLRFNRPEALHHLDGLYTRCSGNPEIPRWLGKRLVTTASAGRQRATDESVIRSSSGLIVVAAAQDDKRHWIETGRLYMRLALTMTGLGIKTAFVNQPVEVASLRSQFQSYLNLGTAQPQLLLRFGYAAAMPRSLRRPVEQVLA
jgi:hypothetical protein